MSDIVWTIGGSKTDLENLLSEIRKFESQKREKLVPDDSRPQPLPQDPDAPMGQIEWYEIAFALATGVVGNAMYDGVKAIIKKYVAARPNQATFTETKQLQ